MTSTNMELLPLVCLCLLSLSGPALADEHGVIKVKKGSDVILPCSFSSKEDIMSKLFDWRKDGEKEIFFYDGRVHSNIGRSGQDEQFKGRVSHFQDELKYGNASIIIRNTKLTDSGHYTCDFPDLQQRQRFHIELVVGRVLKDSSEIRTAVIIGGVLGSLAGVFVWYSFYTKRC
ncbi:immunoglobulin superfamily member 11-like isoform X2 [Micropterus dolomieu]|uniref:immunoglobulin superfamily member 11-like isoform X2 n=1 Tax=Micropterus dolomieu TaxID=147949 RepID=UPI001E8E1676|nr:immunoglobulin superfamily member 11-like isoform X2 [Micropterus dolomieu]